MRFKQLKWILVPMALLGAAALYVLPTSNTATPDHDYETTNLLTRDLNDTVIATGVIRPVVGAEINVGSRISGTVVDLPVEIGEAVKKGDLLARLDDAEIAAQLNSIKANMDLVRPKIKYAEAVLDRRTQLNAEGWSRMDEVEVAIRDLAVERAQLSVYEAQVRAMEVQMGFTRITSPIDGIIADISTREGETVAAGFAAPTFVTILDLDRLEVLAYVDETDIGRVWVGQKATFTVDTYPDTEFEAEVISIQPKAELQNSVVNYIVRLRFSAKPDAILRPEMTAHVQLILNTREGVLLMPRRALKRDNGRQYVLVKSPDGWAERDVRTGWRDEQFVEITSGLAADDKVALNIR